MTYQIFPFGEVWQNGIFNVPKIVAERYIKMASEYQIKALLILLSMDGRCAVEDISKKLGITASDVKDIMEFWVEEGVISTVDGEEHAKTVKQTANKKAKFEEKVEKTETVEETKTVVKENKLQDLTPPDITPKEAVEILRNSKELQFLVNSAQETLARTISQSEIATIIQMVNYYGLNPEIVLTIFSYCKAEREKGRALGVSYIAKMAKNWAEEGIVTLDEAEKKLKAIEKADGLWKNICEWLCISYRKPTSSQSKTVEHWQHELDDEMIEIACIETRENASEPSYKYLKSIVENWLKKGIKTPEQFKQDKLNFESKKNGSKNGAKNHIESAPSYNLDKIKDKAKNNTDIF